MSSRRITSALMFLAIALIAAAFVPVFRTAAAALWCGGLLAMVAAFVVNARTQRVPSPRRLPRSAAVPLGCALVLSLAAFGMSPGGPHASSVTFDPELQPSSPIDVTHSVADLGQPSYDALRSVTTTVDQLEPLSGPARAALVRAAEHAGYAPRSGLVPDFDGATAFRGSDGSMVVRVPLIGTGLAAVSAVTLTYLDGVTTVHEVAAAMVDESHVAVEVWRDGAQTINTVLQEPDDEGAAMTRGLSWSKLNTCLANAGISWAIIAVIGVVCSAACVTVVACGSCIAVAAGFTSGTITACVTLAWT